jgi:hypothetical protein
LHQPHLFHTEQYGAAAFRYSKVRAIAYDARYRAREITEATRTEGLMLKRRDLRTALVVQGLKAAGGNGKRALMTVDAVPWAYA